MFGGDFFARQFEEQFRRVFFMSYGLRRLDLNQLPFDYRSNALSEVTRHDANELPNEEVTSDLVHCNSFSQ